MRFLAEATRTLPGWRGAADVAKMCGGPPAPPKLGEKIVAAIKWVDGTVIDCVRAVEA